MAHIIQTQWTCSFNDDWKWEEESALQTKQCKIAHLFSGFGEFWLQHLSRHPNNYLF